MFLGKSRESAPINKQGQLIVSKQFWAVVKRLERELRFHFQFPENYIS